MLLYLTLLQVELCSWDFFLCLCKIAAGKELGSCSGLGCAVAHTWWLWEGWFCCVGSADTGTHTDRARGTKYWAQNGVQRAQFPWRSLGNGQAGAVLTLAENCSFSFSVCRSSGADPCHCFLCPGNLLIWHNWFFSHSGDKFYVGAGLCPHRWTILWSSEFSSCRPGMFSTICNWRGSTSCAWHTVLMNNNQFFCGFKHFLGCFQDGRADLQGSSFWLWEQK